MLTRPAPHACPVLLSLLRCLQQPPLRPCPCWLTAPFDLLLLPRAVQPATRERVVGAHFFSPAHVMPLLEIVRTRQTSKQVSRAGTHGTGVQLKMA